MVTLLLIPAEYDGHRTSHGSDPEPSIKEETLFLILEKCHKRGNIARLTALFVESEQVWTGLRSNNNNNANERSICFSTVWL